MREGDQSGPAWGKSVFRRGGQPHGTDANKGIVMLKDFKTFIMRGNVVELAVGIVIGVAFGTVISSFVTNLLTPIISLPGTTNFSSLDFTIR